MLNPADTDTRTRLFFFVQQSHPSPLKTQDWPRKKVSSLLECKGLIGQAIADICMVSDVFWDRKQKGGGEIEGIDLLEATGGWPVSSGSKAYLT